MNKETEETPRIFSQEELDNIAGLGEVLRKIHKRLLSEGKIKVVNGKTIFLEKYPKRVEPFATRERGTI